MSRRIPLSLPDITQLEVDAVVDVLRSGRFGDESIIQQFEHACARRTGRREAVAVASGTSALHCCLVACGVGPEDEVITTPFAPPAATLAIMQTGARPVFVDVDTKTMSMDRTMLESAITPRTRAIVSCEALGHSAGLEEIERIAQRHELILLENACEGFGGMNSGRAVGSFGRASCFSFHVGEQITTGEGGMILTDDDRLADLCRSLRNYGRDMMGLPVTVRMGFSCRFNPLGAALGVAQLARLDQIIERRRRVAREYFDRLIDYGYVTLPTIPEDLSVSWYTFVVRLNDLFEPGDRDQIILEMYRDGIECGIHYAPPVHLHPHVARTLGTRRGDFPVCEYISERTIALPIFASLSSDEVDQVCDSLDRAIEKVLMGRCKGRF